MTFFLGIASFYDFLALRIWPITPLFLLLNPKFSAHKFLHDVFLEFYLNLHSFSLKKSHDLFFLVITYFTHDESYSCFFAHHNPLICTPTCCFRVPTPCFVLSKQLILHTPFISP